MIRQRSRFALVLVMAVAISYGCAGRTKKDYVSGSYKALAVGGNSYNAAMSGIAELYKKGYIGDAEKEQALKLATYYYTAYHMAVEALKVYAEEGEGDPEYLQLKLMSVSRALGKLLGYINPILGKYGLGVIE